MLFFLYVLVCKKIEMCLRIMLSIVTTIARRKKKEKEKKCRNHGNASRRRAYQPRLCHLSNHL